MNVAAFFHCWADGAWQQPLDDFRSALDRSDFPGSVHIGLVGSALNCNRVVEEWPEAQVVACEPEGFEAVTLNALRAYARFNSGAVLYAHTKGAATVEAFRDRWRRSMLSRVVGRWRTNLSTMEMCDADAIGCHWLTEDEYPGMFGPMTEPAPGSGFFGGNFWMARCDYLRRLPACEPVPRWKAESWIGIGKPRVVDLLPGWPHDNRWPELLEVRN